MGLDQDKLLLDIHGTTKILSADMHHVKEDLKAHMKRTAVAEHRIDNIEHHVVQVRSITKAVLWILGATATSVGIILGILKFFI